MVTIGLPRWSKTVIEYSIVVAVAFAARGFEQGRRVVGWVRYHATRVAWFGTQRF